MTTSCSVYLVMWTFRQTTCTLSVWQVHCEWICLISCSLCQFDIRSFCAGCIQNFGQTSPHLDWELTESRGMKTDDCVTNNSGTHCSCWGRVSLFGCCLSRVNGHFSNSNFYKLTASTQASQDSLFQDSITKTIGEFAGVLPDYHKPDIMNLINSYMPATSGSEQQLHHPLRDTGR